MSEEKLDFWGKESLVELTEKEIKLYIGIGEVQPFLGRFAAPSLLEQYQAMYASSLSELRKPTKIIPLKQLKRVDMLNNTLKIFGKK